MKLQTHHGPTVDDLCTNTGKRITTDIQSVFTQPNYHGPYATQGKFLNKIRGACD